MPAEPPLPQYAPAQPVSGAKATAVAAGVGGTPLAIVSVMLWESYHPGAKLAAIEAAAIGAVGASLFGYGWHVLTTLIDRVLNRF